MAKKNTPFNGRGYTPKGGSKVGLPKWFNDYNDATTPPGSPNKDAIPNQLKKPNPPRKEK